MTSKTFRQQVAKDEWSYVCSGCDFHEYIGTDCKCAQCTDYIRDDTGIVQVCPRCGTKFEVIE